MKQKISCVDSQLNAKFFHLLDGHIFHSTPYGSYLKIMDSGYINHNGDLKFNYNYKLSSISYGNKIKSVCLFDFKNKTEEEIKDSIHCLYHRPKTVFLFLHPNEYRNIIHRHYSNQLSIPAECWYQNKIAINKISKILILKII